MRLTDEELTDDPFGPRFEEIFQTRLEEADDFYSSINSHDFGPQQKLISRQAYAGRWYGYFKGLRWEYLHHIVDTCRAAVVQAVLSLHCGVMGGGGSGPAKASRVSQVGPQCSGLEAPLQQRCDLHA